MHAATTTNYYARNMVLLAGFTAGLADFLFASIKRTMSGGAWTDPWKGVAGCLIGPAARDGGIEIALLGIALHFFICFVAATLLYFILKKLPALPRHWLLVAVVYGIVFMLVMNYVVAPLSLARRSIYAVETLPINAFWHIVLVGLSSAWFVTRALKPAPTAGTLPSPA
jgi:hypothetical protein